MCGRCAAHALALFRLFNLIQNWYLTRLYSVFASGKDSQPHRPSTQNGCVMEQDEEHPNPVPRHQSCASVAPQRRLSHCLSPEAPDAGTSGEPMEFTIPLGNRLEGKVEPAPEWYDLQQLVLGRNDRDNPPPPEADGDSTISNDMDLQSAMQRMLAANTGIIQHSAYPADNITVSSTSSDEGSIDMDDKTINIP